MARDVCALVPARQDELYGKGPDVTDPPIEISVQAQPRDAMSWRELARRCEAAGVRALLVADHPGSGASPFVALAAAVTTRLRLGTSVVNAGVREAIHIATDVATLDLLSDGRPMPT